MTRSMGFLLACLLGAAGLVLPGCAKTKLFFAKPEGTWLKYDQAEYEFPVELTFGQSFEPEPISFRIPVRVKTPPPGSKVKIFQKDAQNHFIVVNGKAIFHPYTPPPDLPEGLKMTVEFLEDRDIRTLLDGKLLNYTVFGYRQEKICTLNLIAETN